MREILKDFWLFLITLLPVTASAQPLDSIWVSNSSVNSLMKIQRSTGAVVLTVSVPAGRPVGVTIRANGDVWVANQSIAQVHAFDTTGTVIGSFPAAGRPTSMGTDLQGNVWCGTQTAAFVKFSPTGVPTTISPPGCSSSQNICCDSSGNVWLGDGGSGSIFKMSPQGTVLLTLNSSRHRTPVVDHQDRIFTTGYGSTDMKKWANDGTPVGTYPHGITSMQGMAVDADNNVWLANQTNLILKFANDGTLIGSFATSGQDVLAVGVDGMNDIWVSNYKSASLTQMKTDGTIIQTVPVGSSPSPIGDNTGFQRAVFTDPFGDVDMDNHYNNAEAVAGSNLFDSNRVPCLLTIGGNQARGGTAVLDYTDLGNRAGYPYVMACCLSQIGNIYLGPKRRIDLTPDNLFFFCFQAPMIFQNFVGVLDSSGRAKGTIMIPNIAALQNVDIYCGALTVDPLAPDGIRVIAPTTVFKIQ